MNNLGRYNDKLLMLFFRGPIVIDLNLALLLLIVRILHIHVGLGQFSSSADHCLLSGTQTSFFYERYRSSVGLLPINRTATAGRCKGRDCKLLIITLGNICGNPNNKGGLT